MISNFVMPNLHVSRFFKSFSEYPYKFTSELTGKDVVEDDHVEFKIELDEEDGDVKWFKDGVEIIPDGKRIQIVKVTRSINCYFVITLLI